MNHDDERNLEEERAVERAAREEAQAELDAEHRQVVHAAERLVRDLTVPAAVLFSKATLAIVRDPSWHESGAFTVTVNGAPLPRFRYAVASAFYEAARRSGYQAALFDGESLMRRTWGFGRRSFPAHPRVSA